MKTVLLVISFFLTPCVQAQAGTPTIADYVVPTTDPALAIFAHFKIKVNQAYTGDKTNSLSYTFPEELTGNPPLTVNMNRITGTENDWESPEMKALCTDRDSLFSCEIHLNKTSPPVAKTMVDLQGVFSGNLGIKAPGVQLVPFIDKNNVIDFLTQNAVSPSSLQNQIDVLDQFLSSEPAGILSYPFTDYGSN